MYIGSLLSLSFDEVTGNGDKCQNGGEFSLHMQVLLSVNDIFIENHPDGV